jgi:hypothetical protein
VNEREFRFFLLIMACWLAIVSVVLVLFLA